MRFLPFEYAVRNLGRSPRRLAAILTGGVLVILLVLSSSAFVAGMERSLAMSGLPDNVILLGAGSEESIERSQVEGVAAGLVAAGIPGLASRLGVVYLSPEVHTAMVVQGGQGGDAELLALIRGVTPAAFLVHPRIRIVEGRAPEPAANELMVGGMVAARIGADAAALAIGRTLRFADREWTITGRFEAPGTVMDAEIWCPLSDIQIATKRDYSLSCIVLTLGEAEFADVDAFCKQRLDLELVAIRESDYYAGLLAFFGPIRAMVWVTAALIALGGLFGGLNTMYAAFASRVREMGTLQALGFSRLAIVVSLLQESVLASSVGALIAAGIGLLFLDGLAVRFSMGAFGLAVDARVLAGSLGAGLLLGVVGTLPPAWRCLRVPAKDAVRAA